jgi:hypothetical protein
LLKHRSKPSRPAAFYATELVWQSKFFKIGNDSRLFALTHDPFVVLALTKGSATFVSLFRLNATHRNARRFALSRQFRQGETKRAGSPEET